MAMSRTLLGAGGGGSMGGKGVTGSWMTPQHDWESVAVSFLSVCSRPGGSLVNATLI